jgi:hypothetical protein
MSLNRGNKPAQPSFDLSKLLSDTFDVSTFIQTSLSALSESQVRAFRDSLASTRVDAADTLKKNVYQNYKVSVSRVN